MPTHDSVSPVNLDALRVELDRLKDGEHGAGRWINGRVLSVLGSRGLGNASDMAFGVSLVPAGQSTPKHSHRAEELAVVLDGVGVITIDGISHEVRQGDLLRTPPHLVHSTRAAEAGPMYVLWVYAPPGSEDRWFADEVKES